MVVIGLILLGFVLGVFGTLVGAGGGFILMPVLVLLYPAAPAAQLAAVSLVVVFFNALSGSLGYARLRRIDRRSGVIYALAAIPGSIVGATVTRAIPQAAFQVVLGVTLIACAVFLLVRKGTAGRGEAGGAEVGARWASVAHTGRQRVIGIGLSFVVGFVSSVLGIGGGIVHVPLLVYVLGFPVHVAAATSHFVLACTAGAGVVVHWLHGDLREGLARTLEISVGAIAGAQVGAHLSSRVPGRAIVRVLAVAVLLVGLRVVVEGVRSGGRHGGAVSALDRGRLSSCACRLISREHRS